jgi:hypothetical protein
MTTTASRSSLDERPQARRPDGSSGRSSRSHLERDRVRRESPPAEQHALVGYTDSCGRRREVIAQHGAGGSVLVIDHDRATLTDRRLVAHLGADEPSRNAAVVCDSYLRQAGIDGCSCRPVAIEDFLIEPFDEDLLSESGEQTAASDVAPVDGLGRSYRLECLETGMSIPELRWRRRSPDGTSGGETVSVREAIAALESYEPVRNLTRRALILPDDDVVSMAILRAELARVQRSPIVLNRGLRELTLRLAARQQVSMSEIAIRCGRVKRDRAGGESGETSWLARRLGILPEGGREVPTPWIHSDVLALIARRGLGISPREAELG